MNLINCEIGKEYYVVDIPETEEKHFLSQFGVFEGSKISLLKKAPLGGPVLIEVDNSKVAIRKLEASLIKVSE